MKKFWNIIRLTLGVTSGIILGVAGIDAVQVSTAINDKQSTFTETAFDYVIAAPSNDQITAFRSNSAAVKELFPAYHYEISVKGAKTVSIDLLLSDQMNNYDISFFCDERKQGGQYDKTGIMLDSTAASKLGVSVGAAVKFTLGGTQFTLPVCSIYKAVTYRTLDQGIALASWTDEMASSFTTPNRYYDFAFVEANDATACSSMLKNYVPMGPLLTEEEYSANYKTTHSKPSTMTDAEWDAAIALAYQDYRTNYLAGNYSSYVQVKSDYMKEAEENTSNTEAVSLKNNVLWAVLIPLAYALLFILTLFAEKGSDQKDKMEGMNFRTLFGGLTLNALISVAGGVAIAFGIVAAGSTIRTGSISNPACLIYSLPLLGAFLLCFFASFVYARSFYATEQKMVSSGIRSVSKFIRSECVKDPQNARITEKELYSAYVDWMKGHQAMPCTRATFDQCLEKEGVALVNDVLRETLVASGIKLQDKRR